ncbi:MAG: hypothetical protein ACJ72E_01250 [Marmoricola sp.]
MRRTRRLLVALALVGSGLTAAGASPAHAAFEDPIPLCGPAIPTPCLVSLRRDGADVSLSAYRVEWNEESPGSGFYSWFFAKFNGSSWSTDMGADETTHSFTASFDFGSFDPESIAGLAEPAGASPVTWGGTSTHHLVTITAHPVHWLTGCTDDDPPACPPTATAQNEAFGYLSGVASNGSWFENPGAIARTYNLSNIDIARDPYIQTNAITGARAMVFTLASPHENAALETFHGFQHLRLPNKMLRDVYGIPDPDTMTASSLAATLSAGSGTIAVRPEAGHTAMLIDVTGVTFSKRTVKVALGTIVPTRPTQLVGKRLSRTRAKVDFAPAHARGARPTGYLTRCVWHSSVKTVRTRYSVATITHLRAGKHYTCHARALSRAGAGPWSAGVRV